MDTQNLKAFVEVAAARSFSAAAARLHVTQPAISKRVHLLEQQLGTLLFDRIGRQVSLTEAGHTLLPHAEAILARMASARQALADLDADTKGPLKLITSHHIGLHRLPRVLREFSERYPLVELDIGFMDSEEAYAEVLKGHCDLGIITQVREQHDTVCTRTLWKDRLEFVAAPQHPLSQRARVDLEDLAQYPALLPERRFHTTQLVEELFAGHELRLNIKLATNYLETIKALITAGYAWGVLPRSMLEDHILSVLDVRQSETEQPLSLTRNLDCIYHRQRQMSKAARAFFDLLCQHADS
jgi:DNA-binding transcriptional LysR family regulator